MRGDHGRQDKTLFNKRGAGLHNGMLGGGVFHSVRQIHTESLQNGDSLQRDEVQRISDADGTIQNGNRAVKLRMFRSKVKGILEVIRR